MSLSYSSSLVLFVVGLFLLITGPSLFSEGMFLDGTLYASVARNLAEGNGAIWNLHYTDFLYAQFNEHLPFAFWLQSICFNLFGDYLLVERIYSLCTFLISGFLMTVIWRKLEMPKNLQWLPLLYFALMPLVPWCAANNLLENTMLVFVLGSFVFVLSGKEKGNNWYFVLSGILLAFAFLTKGLTGLFIFGTPAAFYFFGQMNLKAAFSGTGMMFLSFVLFFLTLFFFVPESKDALEKYFNRQVFRSLQEVQTVNTRYYIVWKSITESLIPLAIILLSYVIYKRKGVGEFSGFERKTVLVMISVGYLGILPITISLKQSGFYILTALPFLAIALAIVSVPVMKNVVTFWINHQRKVMIISLAMFFIGFAACVYSSDVTGRDKEKVEAVKQFSNDIEIGSVLFINPSMFEQWSLHAYFNRYLKVSLKTDVAKAGSFLLSDKEMNNSTYRLLDCTSKYFLYQVR